MIDLMKDLAKTATLQIVRDWNFKDDCEELWVLILLDHIVPVTSGYHNRVSDILESVIDRCPSRTFPVEHVKWTHQHSRKQCVETLQWMAGPITEREISLVKELTQG